MQKITVAPTKGLGGILGEINRKMSKTTLSQKIIKNTIFGGTGRLWAILISLLLTPYIVSKLGIGRFGIWAIVSILIGYFGLVDFGVGTSYVKYIAEYHTKKDYQTINKIVNTGFVFYLVVGFTIILPIIFNLD